MPELIGKDLVKKQNERMALEIVNDLSSFIESKKLEKDFLVEQIDKVLTKISKKDTDYAILILKLLNAKYSDYNFHLEKSQ